MVLDTGRPGGALVEFHPDGTHLFGGNNNGIQRWRLADRQEVGKQTGIAVGAISVSRDHKWIVCGTLEGAGVWDTGLREKVIHVEGTNDVRAVDVSPDSTRFATGTFTASIWSISGGERLVGPLLHDDYVTGIQFSPNGEHIATAHWGNSVRVFDSLGGDKLITIEIITPPKSPITPLLWSNDGRRIFVASDDKKIKCFDISTGSQLAESQILNDSNGNGTVRSIALAANGSFITTYANRTIFFLDASTLTRIGPIINESEDIGSIALSPDSNNLATGRDDGKISVYNLGDILLDVHDPPQVSSICPFVM